MPSKDSGVIVVQLIPTGRSLIESRVVLRHVAREVMVQILMDCVLASVNLRTEAKGWYLVCVGISPRKFNELRIRIEFPIYISLIDFRSNSKLLDAAEFLGHLVALQEAK